MRARASRPRGLPGDRLLPHVRRAGQVGRADRRRAADSRVPEPCLPRRDLGPPRPGGAGAAGRPAVRPLRAAAGAAGRQADRGGALRGPDGPDGRAARAARARRAPAADRRRQRLERRGLRRPAPLRRGLAVAGGLRVPLPGQLRQRASAVCRRRRARHQSGARQAHPRGRPAARAGPAPGRGHHRRLHAAGNTEDAPVADPRPPGRRGTGPGLPARPADRLGHA